MNDLLQKAIKCLSIQDVSIKSSSCNLRDGFDPKYLAQDQMLDVQLKHLVTKAECLTINFDETSSQVFRVYIDMGARWLLASDNKSGQESEIDQDEEVRDVEATIECMYVAEYLLSEKLEQEALNEFALKNASFHVWPYWREYLMSQCARMNIPKFALPTVQFSKPYVDTNESES